MALAFLIALIVIALLPALVVAAALSIPPLPRARARVRKRRFGGLRVHHHDRPTAA
jgi:hypothetical protein